jgi:CRISPR-associated protein Cas1
MDFAREDRENSAPEQLTIDMVHQFAYCPRRLHLMYVDGRWDDNHFTAEGTSVHRRVDAREDLLPDLQPHEEASASKTQNGESGDPPPAISRSVSLTCDTLGLTGKLDLVEITAGEAMPVETKRGAPPDNPEQSWEPQRVQLMAQTLLLRAHGYYVEKAMIYFAGIRRRVEIPMDATLEDTTRHYLRGARQTLALQTPPPPLEDSPKCNGCSLAGICLPDETNLLRQQDFSAREADSLPPEPLPDPRRLYPAREDAVPLYVQEQGAYVGKSGDHITVKKNSVMLGRFLLKDISQVVLLGNITITAPAISLLAEHSIPILHMSRGWWFHAITAPSGPRNSYLRAAQFAMAADPARCMEFSRQLVLAKGRNQRTLLRRNAAESPELDTALRDMNNYLDAVPRTPDAAALLGTEGLIARCYFDQFTAMLKQEAVAIGFQLDNRNRRPPRDPVNACLSYLYALLAKECTVALMAEGLDPWWGFYHRPRHGKPALALDLMEEFRPLVADSAVITAINTAMLQPQHFLRTAAGCTMESDGRRALIQAYENRLDQLATHPLFDYRASWRTLIRLQARLLGKWLRGDIPVYTGITTR